MQFVQEVAILKSLSKPDQMKLVEALNEAEYQPGGAGREPVVVVGARVDVRVETRGYLVRVGSGWEGRGLEDGGGGGKRRRDRVVKKGWWMGGRRRRRRNLGNRTKSGYQASG